MRRSLDLPALDRPKEQLTELTDVCRCPFGKRKKYALQIIRSYQVTRKYIYSNILVSINSKR